MLSEKDILKIQEIVDAENAEQMISEIMNRFGLQSAEKANFILNEACSISTFVAQHRETVGNQYKAAASTLANGKAFSDEKSRLAHLLTICMAFFPMGEMETTSTLGEKQYFYDLLYVLDLPQFFDWEKKSDWKWAKENGFSKYLMLIQKTHPELRK